MFSEVIAEDRVAVPQQIARELVKGKRFSQLLPFSNRRSMILTNSLTVGLPSAGGLKWSVPSQGGVFDSQKRSMRGQTVFSYLDRIDQTELMMHRGNEAQYSESSEATFPTSIRASM